MLTKRKIGRRQMLKGVGAAALGAAMVGVLDACKPPEQAAERAGGGAAQKEVVQATPVQVSEEAVTIVYWASWTGLFEEMVKRIANAFMEQNSDVKVEHLVIPSNEMDAKIMTSVAAGNPPDVCMIWGAHRVYTLAELKALAAIEDVLDAGELATFKEWVHPPIWDLGTYKGKTWAIPQWVQAYCNVWLPDLSEQAGYSQDSLPKTVDEMRAYTEKVTKKRDDGSLEFIGYWDTWINREMSIWQGKFYDPDSDTFLINCKENVEALTWMTDMAHFYGVDQIAGFFQQAAGAAQGTMDLFIAGKRAVELSGPWKLGIIGETAPDDFTYWVNTIMEIPGKGRGLWTYGDIPCIINGGKHYPESARYVRFLCGFGGPEAYAKLYMPAPEGGGRPHCPISKKLVESDVWKRVLDAYPGYSEWMKAVFEADYTLVPAKVPISSFVNTRIGSAAEKARTDMATPQEALDEAQKDIEEEYERWKKEHPA